MHDGAAAHNGEQYELHSPFSFSLRMLLLLVDTPAGAVCASHAEACTISIQLFDEAIATTLILTDVVLTARDKTVMEYSTLIAKLSTTRFWVGGCFDNNSTTRCVSGSSRR
jgi:hypothetical protein